LFVDGAARRPLGSASLGTLNVLYLALLELSLEQRLDESEIAHVLMAVEEPEAHLHPHLQRLIFRRVLRDEQETQTVVVTTHSPHIASVADPRGLLILRTNGNKTEAAAASDANLDEREWDDIERYLDATRAEMVFARRVLLVEGFAEQVLVPRLALAEGADVDKLGLSVCAIHGTHFQTYARFLDALEVEWAVITDGDPDAAGKRRGDLRAARALKRLGIDGKPSDSGIFVGETTFEFDLLSVDGNRPKCLEALEEIAPSGPSRTRVRGWNEEPPDQADVMKIIERIGKGRVAQRLALEDLTPPAYVSRAIQYLTA
jgi:putative ATP-dependent endonuclease of OLD family